jgi:hypothetical protein
MLDLSRPKMLARGIIRRLVKPVTIYLSAMNWKAVVVLEVVVVTPTGYKDRRAYKNPRQVLRSRKRLRKLCVTKRVGNQ